MSGTGDENEVTDTPSTFYLQGRMLATGEASQDCQRLTHSIQSNCSGKTEGLFFLKNVLQFYPEELILS
jgi:hypothetical protein